MNPKRLRSLAYKLFCVNLSFEALLAVTPTDQENQSNLQQLLQIALERLQQVQTHQFSIDNFLDVETKQDISRQCKDIRLNIQLAYAHQTPLIEQTPDIK